MAKPRLEIAAEKIDDIMTMASIATTYEISFQGGLRLDMVWWRAFNNKMLEIRSTCAELAMIKMLSSLVSRGFIDLVFSKDDGIPQKIKDVVASKTYIEVIDSRKEGLKQDIKFLASVKEDLLYMKDGFVVKYLEEVIIILETEIKKIEK